MASIRSQIQESGRLFVIGETTVSAAWSLLVTPMIIVSVFRFFQVLEMLCPDCQTELTHSPNADVQICENCRRNKKRTRKVPKLKADSRSIQYRVDTAHHGTDSTIAAETPFDDSELVTFVGSWLSTKSSIHVTVFGLLVFLIGQAVHVWAFWAGDYFAWTLANLLTVSGICISVFAVAVTLRSFERRVDALAKLVSRTAPKKPKRHLNKGPVRQK